jgi:hypothetical protein
MMVGSHRVGPQLPRVTRQDFGAYIGQAIVVIVAALALGLAAAIDSYAAAAVIGSAAAILLLGVSFIYRRFGTLIAVWLFFLLQPLMVAAVGEGSAAGRLVNMADIPILLVVGVLGLFFAVRDRIPAVRWLLLTGGVVLLSGFASDVLAGVSGYQSAGGAVLRMKLFLALGAGLAVHWTPALAKRALTILLTAATIAAIAGILDFASGGALRDIFVGQSTKAPRLGYVAAGGLFRNVAVLGTFMVIAFTVLLGMTWQGTTVRRVPQLVLVGLAALSTLRLKAMVSMPAAAIALAITNTRARSRLALVAALGGLAMISTNGLLTGVADEQIDRYTSERPEPRQRLQTASIEIARDNFPLGVGFGQFGSAPSIERGSYSPVYSEYGLASHYGFRPDDPKYALDTSWPGLLGEVGVLGSLAFAAAILALTLLLFRRSQEDSLQADFASIGFGVMVVIIIDSLARATLFESFTMLTVVLIISPALRLASKSRAGR